MLILGDLAKSTLCSTALCSLETHAVCVLHKSMILSAERYMYIQRSFVMCFSLSWSSSKCNLPITLHLAPNPCLVFFSAIKLDVLNTSETIHWSVSVYSHYIAVNEAQPLALPILKCLTYAWTSDFIKGGQLWLQLHLAFAPVMQHCPGPSIVQITVSLV